MRGHGTGEVTPPEPGASGGSPTTGRLGPYVTAWVLAGGIAVGLLAMGHPGLHAPLGTVLVLTALTMFGEWACAEIKAGSSGVTFSLLEAVAIVNLLVLPPVPAVLVTVTGVVLRHVLGRRPIVKAVFNLGQHAVAASAAAALVALTPSIPPLSALRVLLALFAALVYGTINTLAVAGIFQRLGSMSIMEQLRDRPLSTIAFTMRNATLGISGVAIWMAYPPVALLLGAMTAILYLSHGPGMRFQSLYAVVSRERDRLARVVGGVKDGIVLLDDDGAIRLWNGAMERMLGVPEAEAIGQPAEALLTGPDLAGVPLRPDELELPGDDDEDRPSTVSVVTLRARDGAEVPVRMTHALLRDKRNRVTGDVLVIQDMTREREVAALKDDFVARVSHELRTPLTPIRGYVQTLLRGGDRIDAATQVEVLERVVERVGHMERLIDDLLLVSLVASGKARPTGEIDPANVDVVRLVRRLTEWLGQGVASGRHIDIRADEPEIVAWADPVRVGQIITNLLSNACKYGYQEASITVDVSHAGDDVEISVADHGPGIPADRLDAVFDRFERLDDPMQMQTSGLGLGLFLSRELASAMDGTLVGTSELGVGSTFTLILPSGQRPDEGEEMATTAPTRAHPRPAQFVPSASADVARV